MRRIELLHQRQPNVLQQIIPVVQNGDQYRMKVARQWVTLLEWGKEGEAVLTGMRRRSDSTLYKPK